MYNDPGIMELSLCEDTDYWMEPSFTPYLFFVQNYLLVYLLKYLLFKDS